MDDYEKIIRPIVEGQIRDFIKGHPSILKGVNWYKPRSDKATTLMNSLSKRITRALCSEDTRERLRSCQRPPRASGGRHRDK